MEPRQGDPALSDPLFAELRRRHPDVDIVMLPAAPPVPDDAPVATEGQLLALTRHVEAVLDAVSARVGVAPQVSARFWHEQATPLLRTWTVKAVLPLDETVLDDAAGPDDETGPGDGADAGHEAGLALLRQVGDTLLALGWEAKAATDPPRLRAVAGPVEVTARIGTAGVVLVLETIPQHAAAETFTSVREEVA